MKRTLASALVVSAATCFGLTGCGEESKVQQSETVSTPSGSTTVTKETKVESTGGENAPAGSAGTATNPTPAK